MPSSHEGSTPRLKSGSTDRFLVRQTARANPRRAAQNDAGASRQSLGYAANSRSGRQLPPFVICRHDPRCAWGHTRPPTARNTTRVRPSQVCPSPRGLDTDRRPDGRARGGPTISSQSIRADDYGLSLHRRQHWKRVRFQAHSRNSPKL